MNKSWRAVVAMGLCGSVLLTAPARGELVKVNVGTIGTGPLVEIVYHLGIKNKYFEAEGLDIRLVPVGAGTTIGALASGAFDVAMPVYDINLIGAMRESGVKVVANYARRIKGKPCSSYYIVRKDLAAEVRTFADLKGRPIGVVGAGRTQQFMNLLRQLEKAGLTEKDVVAKPISNNTLPAMLLNKEIDVSFAIEPLASRIVKKGLADVFAGTDIADEEWSNSTICYSKRFMENPQAARRFMVAYMRSVRAFSRAAPEELLEIATGIWGPPIDPSIFARLHYMTLNGKIDMRSLMADQKYALSKGWVKTIAKEDEIADPSYVRYAYAVLNKGE